MILPIGVTNKNEIICRIWNYVTKQNKTTNKKTMNIYWTKIGFAPLGNATIRYVHYFNIMTNLELQLYKGNKNNIVRLGDDTFCGNEAGSPKLYQIVRTPTEWFCSGGNA